MGCANRQLLRDFISHVGSVTDVAFLQSGSLIVTASYDTTAKVFEAETGWLVHTLEHGKPYGLVTSLAVSRDERRLATTSLDRGVRVWDLSSGRLLRKLSGHTGEVRAIAFSPDGSRLLSGGDGKSALIWDVATGRNVLTLEGHTDAVNAVAVAPDGAHALTGGRDNKIKIWSIRTGRVVRELTGPQGNPIPAGVPERNWRSVASVAYSPDGSRIVSIATEL